MAEIWVLSDTKPGHYNQSIGLAEAICRQRSELSFIVKQIAAGFDLLRGNERPKLVISAGRRTHFWNLILSLRYSCPNIVLMRPSLPQGLFSLAFVPEHDQPTAHKNVVKTRGAINRMRPAEKIENTGVILLGGPSKHVIWDEAKVSQQIDQILTLNASQRLTLATSRRTPDTLVELYRHRTEVNLVCPSDVDADWLPKTLAKTQRVWVSSDSVSMVYEALTAACFVSLISLESDSGSRTQLGIQALLDEGWIDKDPNFNVARELHTLDEAGRCAEIVVEKRWL